MEEGWILAGQQAVLMKDDSAHIQHETKSVQILGSANTWMFFSTVRHNNKDPNVIKIR
jgi:hypothetical protein